jgi:hypothetical protein
MDFVKKSGIEKRKDSEKQREATMRAEKDKEGKTKKKKKV